MAGGRILRDFPFCICWQRTLKSPHLEYFGNKNENLHPHPAYPGGPRVIRVPDRHEPRDRNSDDEIDAEGSRMAAASASVPGAFEPRGQNGKVRRGPSEKTRPRG